MGIYHFLNLFFYFEILIIFFVFLLIVFKRISYFISEKRTRRLKANISQYIADYLEKKEERSKSFLSPHLLLETLEQYDRRIEGDEWGIVKNELADKYLLPVARNWFRSWFWVRRNFAARVFALAPLFRDEFLILVLVDDRSFLVRSIASAACIKLESRKGVLKTLENMNREPGYGRYFYLDLLSQGSDQIFRWVAEIGEAIPELCVVSLEVFSLKTARVPIPFLQTSLKNSNPQIRIAALKVAIRNPQYGSVELFIECLDDPDEKIRVLGAKGLGNYSDQKSYLGLVKGGEDSSWVVRLECARSLKNLEQIKLLHDPQLIEYVSEFG